MGCVSFKDLHEKLQKIAKKNLKIAEKYVRESVQRLKQQLVVIEMDNDLFSMVLKWKKLKMYPNIYI